MVSNSSSSGRGGGERESLEEARVNIAAFINSNDRAVSISDWEQMARSFSNAEGSVAYARATVRTENSFLEGNIVVVYAWTVGPSGTLVALSSSMKASLKDYLMTKAIVTDYVLVTDGTNRPSPISLRFKATEGFSASEVELAIINSLRGTINSLKPGEPVVYSSMIRTLASIAGVDSLTMATPIADLVTSNTTELFSPPDDDYRYDVDMAYVDHATSVDEEETPDVDTDVTRYEANLPTVPVSPWGVRLFIGGHELAIMPGDVPGTARLFRSGILSSSSIYISTIELMTGKVTLWVKGSQGDLTLGLRTVTSYTRERFVNVYIGYEGESSQSKRREIRMAIRAWADGLDVGQSIYGSERTGIVKSKTNVQSVVESVDGVTKVNRVALATPSSADIMVSASSTELLRCGQIIINNTID
jgi:hypothetical protein